jgi:signal transduction histidine kinase
MKRLSNRSPQWIFYLVTSFYLGTVFLRSILVYQEMPELLPILGALLIWVVFFVLEPIITRKWSRYFLLYLVLQTVLIFTLLGMPGSPDFFASLFVILSMQVMLHLESRIWIVWIALCTIVTTLLLVKSYGSQAFALALLYTAGNVFYGFYAQTTRRAQEIRSENLALAREIQEANQKLRAYSTQMEQLVVAKERNRLARDLHDSVTQTVFSMTLTTQSASLLLERDPAKVESQLDRLSQLAQNALSEMQTLISELRPEEIGRGGLVTALRGYLTSGHIPENIAVDLDIQGEQALEQMEEQNLFHIVQEALNNIVKHSRASKAQVRLCLTKPMWIEIEDQGQGFDLQGAQKSGRMGLHSMRERAEEIGWDLQIRTSLGAGTCVRIEKLPEEVRQV